MPTRVFDLERIVSALYKSVTASWTALGLASLMLLNAGLFCRSLLGLLMCLICQRLSHWFTTQKFVASEIAPHLVSFQSVFVVSLHSKVTNKVGKS